MLICRKEADRSTHCVMDGGTVQCSHAGVQHSNLLTSRFGSAMKQECFNSHREHVAHAGLLVGLAQSLNSAR